MRKAIISLAIFTASCGPRAEISDQEIGVLKNSAMRGDFHATKELYDVCTMEIKLENYEDTANFVSECGGLRALMVENAIMHQNRPQFDEAIEPLRKRYPSRHEFYRELYAAHGKLNERTRL